MKNFGLIDNNIIKFATVDTAFLGIVKNSKATPLNPGNGLVRS
jgi:hypothetical protein